MRADDPTEALDRVASVILVRPPVRTNIELFGSIQNVFDRLPPFDPLTYGAIGYNPLDLSGAVGRFLTVGFRYKC